MKTTLGVTSYNDYFGPAMDADLQRQPNDARATMGNNIIALPIDVFETAVPDKIVGAMGDMAADLEAVHYAGGEGAGGVFLAATVSPFVFLFRLLCGAFMDTLDIFAFPFRFGKDVVDAAKAGADVNKTRAPQK